eukprot:TRINITY_DN55155_c0_g1_i3.p1 TRINITY_DN55155_c0_g1~~TRINITY_DN55155_c0_g1_i3.p1  ORF type:complete len:356 (-),score=46.16 TRINITY_DN55155_c0_g1_i3:202-1269(-)
MVEHVLILGGGIVGCATAHYLRKSNPAVRITIIDPVGIAAAASGRAGGFLARDWHGGPGAPLARHSFALHAELAAEFGAEALGYRPCRAVQPCCPGGENLKSGSEWYDGCQPDAPEISPRDSAAQVVPARLTQALFEASRAELLIGTPSELVRSKQELYIKVQCDAESERELVGDGLLLACGPWTSQVAAALGVQMGAQVLGLKAHSVLMEPLRAVDDSCLFVDWGGDPLAGEFELYPRVDGVYVCGCGESPRVVAEPPSQVTTSDQARACLVASAGSVSSALQAAPVVSSTACYLPVADTGSIVAGKLEPGVWVATGHTCWGILNGPATGQAMAELMTGNPGPASQLLSPFAPR